MNKIVKRIIIVAIAISAAFAYRQRFISVNQEWPPTPVESYGIGEEVVMGKDLLINLTMEGYTLTVNEAEILTYEAFLEKYQGEDEYTYVPEKVYDINVTLKNIDADDNTGINWNEFYLQGMAVVQSLDSNLYTIANPKVKGATSIALRKNTEMEFHLPFALIKENFRTEIWNDLNNFEMDLIATLYPVKKIVKLK